MRRDVSFTSEGLQVRGWLFVPDDLPPGAKAPSIVMANAFGAIKEIYLSNYGERFAAAGFVALAFDYRFLGESEGEPRDQVFPQQQLDDLRNAISWLIAQPEVDPAALGAWGVSLGGGHVIHLSAFDRRIKAAVAMIPAINQFENFRQAMPREFLEQFIRSMNEERTGRYRGDEVRYQALTAPPGEPAPMGNEAYEFYGEAARTVAPTWANRVTGETIEKFMEYNPAGPIHMVAPTPLLMILAEHDKVIPRDLLLSAYRRAGQPKDLYILPCEHTGVYNTAPWVSLAADAAIDWFARHLGAGRSPTGSGRRVGDDRLAENKRRFTERVWSQGDTTVADELIDPDVVNHAALPGEAPGREGYKASVLSFRAGFPDLTLRTLHVVVDGDRVAEHWRGYGTHTGDFMGIPATGKRIELSGIGIDRIGPTGKFVERWGYSNLQDVLQQLGVLPGAGPRIPYRDGPTVANVPATTAEQAREVMRRQIEEIWNQGRFEVIDELFHPQAVTPGLALPPGPEGCKLVVRMFRSAFPDFHITIEDLVAQGELVLARLRQRGTHQGELFGIAPTGRTVDFEEMALLRVSGGQIVESWYETDIMTMMQQLGVGAGQ